MFYQLIEKKRNEWLASKECTITDLLHYIEQRGMMRDVQLEAIKTSLSYRCQNTNWRSYLQDQVGIP